MQLLEFFSFFGSMFVQFGEFLRLKCCKLGNECPKIAEKDRNEVESQEQNNIKERIKSYPNFVKPISVVLELERFKIGVIKDKTTVEYTILFTICLLRALRKCTRFYDMIWEQRVRLNDLLSPVDYNIRIFVMRGYFHDVVTNLEQALKQHRTKAT